MFKFLKRSTVDPRLQLQKALGEFSLPTFPSVVLEALDAIHDPEIDARAMAKILATDPGLTVRVLKTVNSASFSSIRKIDNIRQAVSLMGLSTLEALILSVSIADALPRVDNPCYDFADFWGAAALRATLCRSLADRICPTQRIECFTAGLLQDMALPFLVKQHPEQYAEILTTWRAGDADLAVLERQEFDWDHAEVATWLCSAWDLPEQLSICIGKHHGSMEFEGSVPLPVQLVSCIRDCRENDGLAAFEAAAREKCDFDENAIADLVTASREAATDLKQMML